MSNVILNPDNLDEIIKSGVSLVDFYADWCGPCKMIGPHVEELGNIFAGKANIVKINVDVKRDLAIKYQIRSIPTIFIFKNGNIVEQVSGFQTSDALKAKIEKYL